MQGRRKHGTEEGERGEERCLQEEGECKKERSRSRSQMETMREQKSRSRMTVTKGTVKYRCQNEKIEENGRRQRRWKIRG